VGGIGDRPLWVVVVVSWLLMAGVGASLPERYRVWLESGLSAAVGLVVGLGRLVQAVVGLLGVDVPLVQEFVGLSPLLVGVGAGSVLIAVSARSVVGWVFGNA